MAVELGHTGRLFRTRYAESFVAEQPLLEARLPVPGPMLTLAGETGLQRLRRTYGRQDAGADAAADSG